MTKIETLQDLELAVRGKMSVFDPGSCGMLRKPMPAAFLFNMQGWLILRAIKHGLFIYEPPPKPREGTKSERAKQTTLKIRA